MAREQPRPQSHRKLVEYHEALCNQEVSKNNSRVTEMHSRGLGQRNSARPVQKIGSQHA